MARGVGPPELSPQPRGFGQNSFPAKALASAAKAPNEKKVVRRFRDCVLSKQSSASSCEFNWSAVSSVERKGRLSLHSETTNKTVNVAAMYHLERQTLGKGVHMCLPKLEEVIDIIVEEAEDAAPIGHTIIPENVVGSGPATSVGEAAQEEEEEELSQAEKSQLKAAQKLLYADWDTRDKLLDD